MGSQLGLQYWPSSHGAGKRSSRWVIADSLWRCAWLREDEYVEIPVAGYLVSFSAAS